MHDYCDWCFWCLSDSLSVTWFHTTSLCKHGWTDQGPAWSVETWGLKEHCFRWGLPPQIWCVLCQMTLATCLFAVFCCRYCLSISSSVAVWLKSKKLTQFLIDCKLYVWIGPGKIYITSHCLPHFVIYISISWMMISVAVIMYYESTLLLLYLLSKKVWACDLSCSA